MDPASAKFIGAGLAAAIIKLMGIS